MDALRSLVSGLLPNRKAVYRPLDHDPETPTTPRSALHSSPTGPQRLTHIAILLLKGLVVGFALYGVLCALTRDSYGGSSYCTSNAVDIGDLHESAAKSGSSSSNHHGVGAGNEETVISSTHEEAEARHRLGNCNCGFTADEAIKAGCVFDPVSVSWLPSHCRDEELERQFEYEGLVGTDSDKHDGNENDAHHGNEHHGMAHTNHNSSSGMQMATDGHGQAGWSYFADHAPAGLKPTHLSLETVSRMPPGMFFQASRRWHIARCTWVWLKQQRLRDAERHRVLSGRKGGKGARQEGYREKMAASVWRRNGHDEHEPGHASATVIERRFDTEEHVRHCYRIFLERGPLDELIEGYSVSTRADDADDV